LLVVQPLASCQLNANACSTGADINCLQVVGRILYLLLGTRYKILYHEEPFDCTLKTVVVHYHVMNHSFVAFGEQNVMKSVQSVSRFIIVSLF